MRISDCSSDVCSSDLSSRTLVQTSLYLSSSDSFNAFMAGSLAQPFSMMSSEKASRVPEVEGGPNTEMTELGREGSTSDRSEEHTSELQSLMRISYAVFCLKKKKPNLQKSKKKQKQ